MSALFIADSSGGYQLADEASVLAEAAILAAKQLTPGLKIQGPKDVRLYLPALLGTRKHETFCVAWLNTHSELIKFEEMYQGSLSEARVYPREVIKRGLELNAASMIVVHNHPSGSAVPSKADIQLTLTLTLAASLFEIALLDHFLVAAGKIVSLGALKDNDDESAIGKRAMKRFVLEELGSEEPDFGALLGRLLLGGGS